MKRFAGSNESWGVGRKCWDGCRAGGKEFQILGDATEKLRASNAAHVNGMVSTSVLEDIRE